MWKGGAALAATAIVLLAGSALAPGGSPYIDVRPDPHLAGEPLTVRLFVVNPTPDNASYWWENSCVFERISVVSETRVIGSFVYSPATICLMVIVHLDVPANSSVLWFIWAFDTQPDDGCIWVNVTMRNYPVSGSLKACPGPTPPPLRTMVLTVGAPAAATSAETFGITATARTSEGAPVEGIQVFASLGGADVGTAATGPDGSARLSARAPSVNATTRQSLLVQASGPGWHSASRSAEITIFPPTARYLVLEASAVTGDLIESDGVGIVDVVVRGHDGIAPANVSLAVVPEAPLLITDEKDLGGGRYALTLRASPVNESRVATIRVLANAPGFGGAELRLDYVILAPQPPSIGTGPGTQRGADALPFVVAGVAVSAAAALFAWCIRKPRVRR